MKRLIAVFLFIIAAQVSGQQQQAIFPETIWVPVTFFDFHADSSNPEFQVDNGSNVGGTIRYGMVKRELDSDGLPSSAEDTATDYFSRYIKYWYRDWNDLARGDFTIPVYHTDSTSGRDLAGQWVRTQTVDYDTAFINKVITDSLLFRLVDPELGTYEFSDPTFFPLDDTGFGREAFDHNYSFTMKIHANFIYQQGLDFSFTGDDDVWVFIDRELALDLGGVHTAVSGDIDLDTLGLEAGSVYEFDFFFAERKTTASTVKITTNIFTPFSVQISSIGDSILTAGIAEEILQATVLRNDGELVSEATKDIKWRIVNNEEENDSIVPPATGETLTLYATRAHRSITVIASYTDPLSGVTAETQKEIYVVAGPAAQISIEESAEPDSNVAQHIDTLFFGTEKQADTTWAFVRDAFENLIIPVSPSQWQLQPERTLQLASAPTAPQAFITRSTAVSPSDTLSLSATQSSISNTTTIVISQDLQAQTPVANPPSTDYTSEIQVSLSSQTPNATIYYCINCTPADQTYQLYTSAIRISTDPGMTTTINAYAEAAGYLRSEPMPTQSYTRTIPQTAPPVPTPPGQEFQNSLNVLLTSPTAGAQIFYCVNCPNNAQPQDPVQWLPYAPSTGITLSGPGPFVLQAYADAPDFQPSVPMAPQTYTNTDWQGPQVVTAHYYLATPPGASVVGQYDTLVLTFDEPVPCANFSTQIAPLFEYQSSKGFTPLSSAQIAGCNQAASQITLLLNETKNQIVPIKDNIRFTPGMVSDQFGNTAAVDAPNIVIAWGRDYDLIIEVSYNPFIPFQTNNPLSNQVMPSTCAASLRPSENATSIRVISVSQIDTCQSTLDIYDGLGTLIISSIKPYRDANDPNAVHFFWSGLNRNNRLVATGTYLGVVAVKTLDSESFSTQRFKIGLQHN